jgi:hypothetical protein
MSKTTLHLSKKLSRIRIIANYWHLIVRRCEVGVCVFIFALPILAATDGPERLKERYATFASKLNGTAFGAPVYIESDDRDDMMRGGVFGILPGAFASFSATLRQLPAWCDLLTLHFNIKGCTYQTESDVLRVYSGGKRYEDPREARRHEFLYTVPAASRDYLHIVITSADGPLDTYDYLVEVEAMPLGEQTFAYVHFTYRYRILTRMMSSMYFMTAGRDKVGFSVVGADKAGNPLYIKGRGGAMERSVMRYYLGLQALLESRAQPEAQRFEWRVQRWYALTDKYRRQLYELDEEEYLDSQRKERVGWTQLQAEIDGKK